jgi:hypothetical protein
MLCREVRYSYSFIDMSSGFRSRGGGVGPMDPCYALYTVGSPSVSLEFLIFRRLHDKVGLPGRYRYRDVLYKISWGCRASCHKTGVENKLRHDITVRWMSRSEYIQVCSIVSLTTKMDLKGREWLIKGCDQRPWYVEAYANI